MLQDNLMSYRQVYYEIDCHYSEGYYNIEFVQKLSVKPNKVCTCSPA